MISKNSFIGFVIALTIFFIFLKTCSPSKEQDITEALEKIFAAQIGFKSSAYVDQDKDGEGEYGLFNELTGKIILRGGLSKLGTNERPIFLVPKLQTVKNYATFRGYNFQIFLPHTKKPLTDSNIFQNQSKSKKSIDAQENCFIVYAWPAIPSANRYRCYVVDQTLQILVSSNRNKDGTYRYVGSKGPIFYAAMPKNKKEKITSVNWVDIKIDAIGVDGQVWKLWFFR